MCCDFSSQGMALDWIADPYREWPVRYPGRRAFGYLCTYAPLEVLHAAGFTPVRLMQSSGAVVLADAHLPSFACALARTVTERMLSGGLDFLAGVLFPHTCDTMQCVADIWRMARPCFRVVTFSLPTVLSGPSHVAYALAQLHGLSAVLESEFDAPVTEEGLRTSIALYNEQRRLLAALYEQRSLLSAEQVWMLTQASMLMPVEDSNTQLRSALAQLGAATQPQRRGPALVLVGAVLDEPTIPRLIDELDGRVVTDDLCTGSRYFDALVHEAGDPFEALAGRYWARAPCPCKHDPAYPRAERLLQLVHSSGAQGVVFVLPKFCDPHAFDAVPLAQALDAAGVPHVTIETDVTAPTGQLRTRLQAFIEMLRDSVA